MPKVSGIEKWIARYGAKFTKCPLLDDDRPWVLDDGQASGDRQRPTHFGPLPHGICQAPLALKLGSRPGSTAADRFPESHGRA